MAVARARQAYKPQTLHYLVKYLLHFFASGRLDNESLREYSPSNPLDHRNDVLNPKGWDRRNHAAFFAKSAWPAL
jgi:hypothetical protein